MTSSSADLAIRGFLGDKAWDTSPVNFAYRPLKPSLEELES